MLALQRINVLCDILDAILSGAKDLGSGMRTQKPGDLEPKDLGT